MTTLNANTPTVGLLIIGRKRPGFDPQWGKLMEQAALATLSKLGLPLVRHANIVNDDDSLRIALAELQAAGAAALVVMQPTMGDGRLSPIIAQLWARPVVLWATPERPEGGKVSACSLVAAQVFAANLRQLGFGFELVYGDPSDAAVQIQLKRAIHLTAAAGLIRRCKLGLVGYHAPGFIDMHVDPASIMAQFGVAMHHLGIQEFMDLYEAQDEAAVHDDLGKVAALKLPRDDKLVDADLLPNCRYYLAMKRIMDEQHLDALALRCWPELPNRIGHWPYLAMSRLTDEHRVVALEGDADGALLGLLGKLLGLGPGYLTDWLEHTDDSIMLWHPGHAPRSLCDPDSIRLSRHFNDNKPLVLDAELQSEIPITLSRLWRCDNQYHLTAFNARTINPTDRKHWHGASGLACLDTHVPTLLDNMLHAGMPHHLTLFPGHHTESLRRLARQLKLNWVAAD
jgi:L-fucose isomerase-like protein